MTTKHSYSLRVCFWGVRGSTPTPQSEYMGFGGNTACVEVETSSGTHIILDAGSGLRLLGDALMAKMRTGAAPIRSNLLLSHLHWDHIQGFPFFRPVYSKQNTFNIFGVSAATRLLQSAFRDQLSDPYFPVAFNNLPARLEFKDLPLGKSRIEDVTVITCALTHPQGATAYRLEYNSKVVTYASDHEHGDEEADRRLIQLAKGSDLMIADAQYTREEYEHGHRGWGHSTWDKAVRAASAADVKELVLTHHDPWHDDAALLKIEDDARAAFPQCTLAREGMQLYL